MMSFRKINKAIIKLLGDSALGRFSVVGYQRQGRAASEVKGKGSVQSFYSEGTFPKHRGRANSTTQHEMTFTLALAVSAAAKCNLSIINAPAATPAQITQALEATQEAGAVADDLIDELFELVYQILMDARNIDLGLPPDAVTQRWVASLKKDAPMPMGSLLSLTGSATFTCSADEEIPGDVGTPATEGFDTTLDIAGDDVEVTGVISLPGGNQ